MSTHNHSMEQTMTKVLQNKKNLYQGVQVPASGAHLTSLPSSDWQTHSPRSMSKANAHPATQRSSKQTCSHTHVQYLIPVSAQYAHGAITKHLRAAADQYPGRPCGGTQPYAEPNSAEKLAYFRACCVSFYNVGSLTKPGWRDWD